MTPGDVPYDKESPGNVLAYLTAAAFLLAWGGRGGGGGGGRAGGGGFRFCLKVGFQVFADGPVLGAFA